MWLSSLNLADRSLYDDCHSVDSGPVELISFKTDSQLDLIVNDRPLKSRLSCDFMDASPPHSPLGGSGSAGGGECGPGGDGAGVETEETSGWSKFQLLLWKNWVVQKRHKVQTLVEIALPVFFASLLVLIRDLAPADVFNNATVYPAYRIEPNLPDIPSAASIVGSKVNTLSLHFQLLLIRQLVASNLMPLRSVSSVACSHH